MSVVVPVVVNYSKNYKRRVLLKIPSEINADEDSRKQFISSACNRLREINYQQRIGRSREAGLADAASTLKSAKRGKIAQYSRLRNRFAGLGRVTPQTGENFPVQISDPGSGLGYDVSNYSRRSRVRPGTSARPFESRVSLYDPSAVLRSKRAVDDSEPSMGTRKYSRGQGAADDMLYL